MATKTLNLALDDELIKKIDETIKKEYGSRSEYFRRLALADLDRRQKLEVLFDNANRKGRAMGITSEQQVYDTIAELKREKQQ